MNVPYLYLQIKLAIRNFSSIQTKVLSYVIHLFHFTMIVVTEADPENLQRGLRHKIATFPTSSQGRRRVQTQKIAQNNYLCLYCSVKEGD